jgi:hypothetical protein
MTPNPSIERTMTETFPSWRDGAAKSAITDFVARVCREGSPDFVPPAERIATFDNDDTLWAEQPLYFQFLFAIDRVKALAPQHPEWKHKVIKGGSFLCAPNYCRRYRPAAAWRSPSIPRHVIWGLGASCRIKKD